jgi:hypothetical protein
VHAAASRPRLRASMMLPPRVHDAPRDAPKRDAASRQPSPSSTLVDLHALQRPEAAATGLDGWLAGLLVKCLPQQQRSTSDVYSKKVAPPGRPTTATLDSDSSDSELGE